MAVLALSVAGAAAGSAIGGTFLGVSAASWGWMAGSMLGNALFAEGQEGPRIDDLRVTGTQYGQPIPWVAGSPRIAGQIVWASNKRETANTQGGKGGPEVTTYTYDCDLLILLTENEIAGVSRIWSNSELVYDGTTTKSGVWSDIRIYTGAVDQLPDPTYESAVGAGNAPAYRCRGSVFIQGLQLGGNGQIPNLTFELALPPLDNSLLRINYIADGAENLGTVDVSATYTGLAYADSGGYYADIIESSTAFVNFVDTEFNGNIDFEDSRVIEFILNINNAPGYSLGTVNYLIGQCSDGGLEFVYWPGGQKVYLRSTSPSVSIVEIGDALIGQDFCISLQFITGQSCRVFLDGVYKFTVTLPVFFDRISFGGTRISGINTGFGARVILRNVYIANHRKYTTNDNFTKPTYFDPYIISGQTSEPSLNQSCSWLLDRSGYNVADYSVDSFDGDVVRALSISQNSSTRVTLDLLKSSYFFETSKSDKIYIFPRAVDPVATIYYSEMGANTDPSNESQAFEIVKSNDIEIPAQIALSYHNMAGDYNIATEHSDRILSEQESTETIQIPLGFLPSEAKDIADAMIIDAAASVVRATIRVPLEYAYLEPGDVINAVNDDGRTYRLRIQAKRDSLTIIELECVIDDVGALDSSAITDDGYAEAEVIQVAQSEFEALDIPLLRDADDGPGYYIAVAPDIQTDPYEWKGALVARAWDDVNYSELFTTSNAATMGTCSNTLGNWTGGNVFDETNTLTIVTTGGALSSSTRAAMQLDPTINVMAVGSAVNGWEIIRFRNATLTATNTYVLSGLHRGFRGTEWAIGSHVASEQAILLKNGVVHVASQVSQIGLLRYIKAATFGLFLSTVTSEEFTDTGNILKPFSPANPVALADGSDVFVTWQRRTRVSYVYGGATPTVPLGESTEQYRVRIYDGVTLVRTATVTSPTYTYAAADIASDGFLSTDTITFEICQLSEIVGAGYPAECEGIAP